MESKRELPLVRIGILPLVGIDTLAGVVAALHDLPPPSVPIE
jgi:hypothetical protein